MTLPANHPWKTQAPQYGDDYFLYLDIGASNAIGGGTAVNNAVNEDQKPNFNYSKTFKHDGVISNAVAPINDQSVNTYDALDETGRYNRNNRLLERIRERVKRKICVVGGGSSARALNNITDGWRSVSTRTEIETLTQAAETATNTNVQFAMFNVLGRDTVFSSDGNVILPILEQFLTDIRTGLGNSTLPIFVIGLGPTPPTLSPSPYQNWASIRDVCATISQANTYFIDMDGDTTFYNTYIHDQRFDGSQDEVHWNALGQNLIADRVFNELVAQSVI